MGSSTDKAPAGDHENDVAVKELVQRQLMLLDFQTPETDYGLRIWPVLPGLSACQSRRMFAMMERWGWIAGSACDSNGPRCIITSRGVGRLEKIKNGQPLVDATDMEFMDEDRRILENSASKQNLGTVRATPTARKGCFLWQMTQLACSRPGLWAIVCTGIALMATGIHPGSVDNPPLETWQAVRVVAGAAFVVLSLRLAYRNIERSRPSWGWLPAGISALVFIPLAWALFDGRLGTWWFLGALAAIGVAGCPIPACIFRLLPGSTVRRCT